MGQYLELNDRLPSANYSFPTQNKTYLHVKADNRHELNSGLEQLLFFWRPHGIWNGKSSGLCSP